MIPSNISLTTAFFAFWISLFLLPKVSYAHELEYITKAEKPTLVVGKTLSITDPFVAPVGATEGSDFIDEHKAIVELNYDRSNRTDIAGQSWSYEIAYELIDAQTNTVIDSGVVKLDNQDEEGVYESLGIHEDVVSSVKVRIKTITSSGGTTVPEDIHFALKLQVNRYNKLDETTALTMALSSTVPDAKQQVEIYWQPITGAEYYELEWVYWDGENTTAHTSVSDKELFKQGIRIQTSATHYKVDLVYPNGTVHFRVRPIGCFVQAGLDNPIEKRGTWCANQFVTLTSGFEAARNWSFNRSYAEEGKHKQVIQYFDDGLKGRQTLTTLSSEDITLVAEALYDVENRPALAIMPVPVKNDAITGSNLQFGAGHSSGLITTGGITYNRTAYDNHNAQTATLSQALPQAHLANQYYSSSNNFTNHIHRDYVPDAEGYPVAQTSYDNDGRAYVKANSGVGAFYQLGTGRESEYYYASPTNTELQSFFGENVGEGQYYRKTWAKDANGQLAVSITDQAGQTILTALDGAIPDNVQPLDGSSKIKTETLMGSNITNAVDQTSEVHHTFMCTQDSATYSFEYNLLDAVNILHQEYGFCLGCSYELEISVEDQYGNLLPLTLTTANDSVHIDSTGTLLTSTYSSNQNPCTDTSYQPANLPIQFEVQMGTIGTYTIHKSLRATGPDADDILAHLLTLDSVMDQSTFINNYITSNFDSTLCRGNGSFACQSICEEITLANYPNLDLTDTNDLAYFQLLVDTCMMGDCDSLRQQHTLRQIIGGTECEAMLLQMKQQMSPGGCWYESNIYRRLYDDGNGVNIPSIVEVLGIGVSQTIYFTDTSIIGAYLEDPTVWQDSWADVLVTLHPEYCRYEACDDSITIESKLFDFELTSYETWQEVGNAFSVTTSTPALIAEKRAILSAIIANDPYFQATGNGSLETDFISFFNNYCTTQCSTINAQQGATVCTCSCGDIFCYLDDNVDTLSTIHWNLFRGIYNNEKLRVFYDNQCALVNVPGKNILGGCDLITGPPVLTTINQNGDTSIVNLLTGVNNTDSLNALLYNNVLGNGTGSNTNSLCNQLCTARADFWIQQMCPDFRLAALADTTSGEYTTYNTMMTQLVDYCLTGCGQLTRPDSAAYPYQANPLGYLVLEDLNHPPFTGSLGIIAIIDALQNSNPSYCGTGGGLTTLTGIATRHDSLYQLNVTNNNVFANLPVDSAKCSILTDVFTALNSDLFPTRYVYSTGNVPNTRTFNHTTAPLASLVEGLPSEENYNSGTLMTVIKNSNPYFASTDNIYLDNEYLYDSLGNRTDYNRAIRIQSKFFEEACADNHEIKIELEHQITRQLINPMAIVSLGTYNCLDNTIQVVYATPDCYYSSNTQGSNTTNTACNNPVLDTVKAYVKISTDACIPSWELSPDSTWIPIVRTVTIDIDSAIAACDSSQIAALTQDAQDAYQQYLNTLVNQILDSASCVPVAETLTMTFESNEQHYTLYYYDAAGNLVQTLPPAAVNPLESSQVGTGLHPAHNYDLLTTYTYNSLGQVLTQNSPDGGLSVFYYDYAQRLRLSQNARQAPTANNLATYGTGGDYAYSKYDARGRVIEVGKLEGYLVNQNDLNAINFPNSSNHTLSEQTFTEYDEASGQGSLTQNYLRSRVARTYNEEVATYYDYDIHGNVKKIQHQIKQFGVAEIAYDYDLITGNVNQVAFQEGTKDAYYHRYSYDADNRLTHVLTSDNGCLWHQEARYFYYAHGPLARVELGADKVQGLDYYYNLQGWIKGVNNTTAATDPGRDGDISGASFNANEWIGKDEQAFYLGYHREDYKPIGGSILGAFEHTSTSIFDNDLRPATASASSTTGLLNGNIAFMITHLPALEAHTTDQKATNAMVYQYDALHRIKQGRSYHLASGTTWTKDASNEHHNTEFSYDANGNIETLKRYHKGSLIDNLDYKYTSYHAGLGTATGLKYNQLNYINDIGTGAATVGDLEDQDTSNYQYDAIGNLLVDESQDIENILWDLSNKIEKVTYTTASGKSPLEYTYDAMGQRLTKTKTVNGERISTVYIRDAGGNIMGVYEMVDTLRENVGQSGGPTFPPGTQVCSKRLEEVSLYGASRLGVKHYSNNWITYAELTTAPKDMTESLVLQSLTEATGDRGHKVYELSNHLGNVLATVSDKKLGQILGGSIVASYYEAQVQTASDYYPFGWQIPSRKVTNGENYRYSFNGVEQDQEWHGGQSMAFEFRTFDPRVGRFLSTDPLTATTPWETPYAFAGNSPVANIDYLGLSRVPAQGSGAPPAAGGGNFWQGLGSALGSIGKALLGIDEGSSGGGGRRAPKPVQSYEMEQAVDLAKDNSFNFDQQLNLNNSKEQSEPPVRGLPYFGDDTGDYYWNEKLGSYDHHDRETGEYIGQYNTFWLGSTGEPVGDYNITFFLSEEDALPENNRFTTKHTPMAATYYLLYLRSEANTPGTGRFVEDISDETRYPGVKIFSTPHTQGGITLGNIIFVNDAFLRREALPNGRNRLLEHEYGHYLDYKFSFRYVFFDYFFDIGVPSLGSAAGYGRYSPHKSNPVERRADILSEAYFRNKYGKK